jgi:hypothetical protein
MKNDPRRFRSHQSRLFAPFPPRAMDLPPRCTGDRTGELLPSPAGDPRELSPTEQTIHWVADWSQLAREAGECRHWETAL